MDLSAALHHFRHQEMGSHSDSQSLDSMIASSKHPQAQQQQQQQQQDSKKPKPPDSEPQKCPRCDSTNTKFCYYNNYSLTQPRYFCKSCRRYWTKGGTLRNVPVGGGCRRNNKRCSSSSVSSPLSHSFSATSFLKRPHAQDLAVGPPHNPLFSTFGGGLGLGFGFDPTANVTEFDGFLGHPHLINPIDHQSLCYGFGAPNADDLTPFEGGAVKQQISIENKGLWGYHQPWQVINNGDYNHGGMGFGVLPSGDLEPIKETWTGLIGNSISTWQAGLLNTPALM